MTHGILASWEPSLVYLTGHCRYALAQVLAFVFAFFQDPDVSYMAFNPGVGSLVATTTPTKRSASLIPTLSYSP